MSIFYFQYNDKIKALNYAQNIKLKNALASIKKEFDIPEDLPIDLIFRGKILKGITALGKYHTSKEKTIKITVPDSDVIALANKINPPRLNSKTSSNNKIFNIFDQISEPESDPNLFLKSKRKPKLNKAYDTLSQDNDGVGFSKTLPRSPPKGQNTRRKKNPTLLRIRATKHPLIQDLDAKAIFDTKANQNMEEYNEYMKIDSNTQEKIKKILPQGLDLDIAEAVFILMDRDFEELQSLFNPPPH